MGITTVLVPTPSPATGGIAQASGGIGDLAGKVVGFRLDELWRSWDWVADEWSRVLRDLGAEVVTWRASVDRVGDAAVRQAAELDDFARGVDLAVSGLGNCGSCTAWTMWDAASVEATGTPTVAVVTASFEGFARMVAASKRASEMPLVVLPHPFDTRPESEVRQVARARFDRLLACAGADVGAGRLR